MNKLNEKTYQELIQQNLDWLREQPQTLENKHIVSILVTSQPEPIKVDEKGNRLSEPDNYKWFINECKTPELVYNSKECRQYQNAPTLPEWIESMNENQFCLKADKLALKVEIEDLIEQHRQRIEAANTAQAETVKGYEEKIKELESKVKYWNHENDLTYKNVKLLKAKIEDFKKRHKELHKTNNENVDQLQQANEQIKALKEGNPILFGYVEYLQSMLDKSDSEYLPIQEYA